MKILNRHIAVKLWGDFALLLIVSALSWAGTVPNQITYQGTIKELGVPVDGIRTMLFRLTNSDGSVEYWRSGNVDIDVTKGIFSTVLSPTGVDWQNVTPYVELSAGQRGQTPSILLPRQPLMASVFSFMSGTVVDASITTSKLSPSVSPYLIPAGMVAPFAAASCPPGWTEVTALRGRAPFGQDPTIPIQFALNTSGGSLAHAHSISADGAHNHGGHTISLGVHNSNVGQSGGTIDNFTGGINAFPFWGDVYDIAGAPDHSHGSATGGFSTLPPYWTVLYCSKS